MNYTPLKVGVHEWAIRSKNPDEIVINDIYQDKHEAYAMCAQLELELMLDLIDERVEQERLQEEVY